MESLMEDLFALSPEIRYVAVLQGTELQMRERANLTGASASESDRYEERLVNPTLITLTRQRGNIDCGGMEYLIIRYGHFYQLVMPAGDGQVSIAFELNRSPLDYVGSISGLLARHGLLRS